MTDLKVGSITFAPGDQVTLRDSRGDVVPGVVFDAVWYLPEHKDEALTLCRALTEAEVLERGKSRDLHGFGFAINGIPHPLEKKPSASLVYCPERGLYGLSGSGIAALCGWTEIKPGLLGGRLLPDTRESAAWAERERICAKVEADAMAAKSKLDSQRLIEEYGALAECASRYVELCEEFHKRGKIRKKEARRIIGRMPHPDGVVLARAYARISGERAPVASDPEAAAGSMQAQVVQQVQRKRRAS